MKAEGSAADPDADHIRSECLIPRDIHVVELATPEVRRKLPCPAINKVNCLISISHSISAALIIEFASK